MEKKTRVESVFLVEKKKKKRNKVLEHFVIYLTICFHRLISDFREVKNRREKPLIREHSFFKTVGGTVELLYEHECKIPSLLQYVLLKNMTLPREVVMSIVNHTPSS